MLVDWRDLRDVAEEQLEIVTDDEFARDVWNGLYNLACDEIEKEGEI